MDKIFDGDDIAARGRVKSYRMLMLSNCMKAFKKNYLDTQPVNKIAGEAVAAQISFSRWVAICPDCGGVEYVSKTEKFFYCLSCGNIKNSGRLRPVKFPRDIEGIEAMVLDRPVLVEGVAGNPINRAMNCKPHSLDKKPMPRDWQPGISKKEYRGENKRIKENINKRSAK